MKLVYAGQLEQFFPEVGIQGGLFVGLHPAPFLPAFGPALLQRVNDIFGIRPQFHPAGLLQDLQRGDHSRQFHAVVGGTFLAAAQLLFVFAEHEDGPPAPGAGVAGTGAVGV